MLVIFCASHRVIFSPRESDIETYGFSDIIFASKTREANITWTKSKYNCEAISLAVGEYN